MCSNVILRIAFVGCLLSAVCTSAQNQSYLLRSEGAVSVNGVAVRSSALVSEGDVVQTGKGSSAKIASPGMAMLVGENSRVAVSNGNLAIDRGSASVSSTGRISTTFSQYTIKPLAVNSTRYMVSNHDGSLFIKSESGGLAVTGPNMASKNVLSGQKARFAGGASEVSSATDSDSAQPGAFHQQMGSYSSNLCRTAASCYCKTAAQCPNK